MSRKEQTHLPTTQDSSSSSDTNLPAIQDSSSSPVCFICYNVMADTELLRPVLLRCGHSLCQGCWTKWKGCDRTKKDFGIDCPFCRSPILDQPVVRSTGLDLSSVLSSLAIVIDPVHPGGKYNLLHVPCTSLTTGESIINHLDPLIEREFKDIPFPKQHLELSIKY